MFKFLKIDTFLMLIMLAVALASFFPCEGEYKTLFEHLTSAAIALLFFMHGAKLSSQSITNGIRKWQLHIVIFTCTFILFPLIGLSFIIFVPTLLTNDFYLGFLYLCALPATVQSAIAFTSIARGNLPAAICSASASSLLGVFLSPVLVSLLMTTESGDIETFNAILSIMLKLMLPFIIGHLCRPLILNWIEKHRRLVNQTDRTSILLVVYVAFSDAVVNGIWQQVDGYSLFIVALFSIILLIIMLFITTYGSRWLGFNKEDEITIVFCGSKKSLANGIPMASVLFPAASVGLLVLPLMIFHQIQLMVCSVMAAQYAKRPKNSDE